MADQGLVVGDPDAAEPDRLARPEAVGVETLADAGDAGPSGEGLGHGEILRIGELHQHGVARRRHHLAAGSFDGRGVIGRRLGFGPGGIAGLQLVVAEGLGRLHPEQARARDRRQGAVAVVALEGVGHSQDRHGPVRLLQRRQQHGHVPRLHKGPGGVVDQHRLGGRVGQGLKARHDRIRALGPAQHDGHAAQARQGLGRRGLFPLGDGDDQPFGAGGRQALGRPAQHRLAGEQAPLLRALAARAAADPCGGDDG